jgi:hypothetical protein
MDTRLYPTTIEIDLAVVGRPCGRIQLDGRPVTFGRVISEPTTVTVTQDLSAGAHCLEIHHQHKAAEDPDTALIVQAIRFNSIGDDQFVWSGRYRPDYPEPWATQQQALGNTLALEIESNYLGWNGIWRLEFTAPIFTWIHQVRNLGWIYR